MSGRMSAGSQRSAGGRVHSAEGGTGTVNARLSVSVRGTAQSEAPVPVLPSHRQGLSMTDEWPLGTFIELGALPGAVPCARLHARQVLWEWGLADPTETVELIVSELVTNAVQASEGLIGSRYAGRWTPGVPPVRLWLTSNRQRILVQVWDGNHQPPQVPDADLEAESGRGLLLVGCLSAGWGSYAPEGSSGKVVWAAVDATTFPH